MKTKITETGGATPRTWKWRRVNAESIEIVAANYPVAHINHDTRDTAEMEANAALIVQAVNEYDALNACAEILAAPIMAALLGRHPLAEKRNQALFPNRQLPTFKHPTSLSPIIGELGLPPEWSFLLP